MANFNEMLKNSSIKNSNKIKLITRPLSDILGVKYFHYGKVNENGEHFFITNNIGVNEYWWSLQEFNQNPYVVHPKHMHSCVSLPKTQDSPLCQKTMNYAHKELHLNHMAVFTKKNNGYYETFTFGSDISDHHIYELYMNERNLLMKYMDYFKCEAETMIHQLEDNPVDMLDYLGPKFYKPDFTIISGAKKSAKRKFLQRIGSLIQGVGHVKLTNRELDCLRLYFQGKTAKETGEILQLSTRTIEHYFENIKMKLCCNSKKDLYKHIDTLEQLGFFTSLF